MKSRKPDISGGCIIADNMGEIVFINEIARQFLPLNPSDNITLSEIKNFIRHYDYDCIKTEKHEIYWINDNEANDFISSILENSFDEIFVCDNQGRAIYCNKSFEKHYGKTCDEIIGKSILTFAQDGVVDRSFLRDVINTKKPITYEQKTAAGKTILNTSTPVLDGDGNLMFIVENCRDVTEINELKSNLYDVQSQLIEAKRNLNDSTEYLEGPEFDNPQMKEIDDLVANMAPRDINILITGKSGTGKTRIAKQIHNRSSRRNNPFVSINCSTIPLSLIESELFGYEKGAFTGASDKGKIGLVEKAGGGTLFLDEIGEIPLSMQVKLLELVQEHTYMPVGATKNKKIDVRIIAATNQDLTDMISEKKFREDLYYRLSVVRINIPSLCERPEDVNILLEYYMNYFNKKHSLKSRMTQESKNILLGYSWPGNIRELEHLVEFLVLNSNGNTIEVNDLPANVHNKSTLKNILKSNADENSMTLQQLMEMEEKRIIRQAHKKFKSSYGVAKRLGISQSKAYRLIMKHCKD